MAFAAALLLCSCGGKKSAATAEQENLNNPDGPVSQVERDSTIYGMCRQGTDASTLKFVSDIGETYSLDMTAARRGGRVFGDVHVGDRLAVVLNHDSTAVYRCVNLTTLLGDWVQISAFDGSSEIGMRIKDGGIVEGIDQSDIIYQTWRIYNSYIELHWKREGGGQEEEMGVYTMLYLSPDSLSFSDTEDVYEYNRPHPVEDMGVHAEDFGESVF
jgi:hypothetical protein